MACGLWTVQTMVNILHSCTQISLLKTKRGKQRRYPGPVQYTIQWPIGRLHCSVLTTRSPALPRLSGTKARSKHGQPRRPHDRIDVEGLAAPPAARAISYAMRTPTRIAGGEPARGVTYLSYETRIGEATQADWVLTLWPCPSSGRLLMDRNDDPCKGGEAADELE